MWCVSPTCLAVQKSLRATLAICAVAVAGTNEVARAQNGSARGAGVNSSSPPVQTSSPPSTGVKNPAPPRELPKRANEPNALGYPAGEPGKLVVRGAFFERYREDTHKNDGGVSGKGSVTYGSARLTYNFDPRIEAYVRLAGQLISPEGPGRDYNTNYYRGTTGWRGAAALDQFGIIYRTDDRRTIINLGRQDEPLDASGTLYDLSYRVGLHTFLDGVSIVHIMGASTIQAYLFSEDQYRTKATRNGLYALRGTYSPLERTTLGVTIGHFQSSVENQVAANVESTNNYEADIVQKFGKLQLTAEYGRSSARTRNELYYVGGNYFLTPHDKLTIYTYAIDQNADMGRDSGYPNNFRGERYFLEHFLNPRTEIIFWIEANQGRHGPQRFNSFQITGQYTF